MYFSMSKNKPRIAFCFSWQARTLDQIYQFFQKNLFDAAKEQWFEYDVFCAVEDDENIDKVNLLNPTKIEKIKSSQVENIIRQSHWDFIDNCLLENYWYTWFDWHMSMLHQLYKIQEAIKLKQEHEKKNSLKYDIVFKLRFDCAFLRKLNFENIYNDIKKSDKIVICNRNKMIPSYKFLIKIEDFYLIMDDKTSDILWDFFQNRENCFKWHEIKNKKLNKIFCNSHYNVNSTLFRFLLIHIYSLFFWYSGAENQFLNYFKVNKITVKKIYISIWWFKDKRKYKLSDFKTHSKVYLCKKSIYEI